MILKTKFIGLEGFEEIESISAKKNSVKKLSNTEKTVRFIKRAAKLCAKTFKVKGAQAKRLAQKQLKAVKSQRTAAKTATISKAYADGRRGSSDNITRFVKPESKGNKRAKHMDTAYRPHTLIKKRAVIAVVASLTAVTLSAITVAGALDFPVIPAAAPVEETTAATTAPVATVPATTAPAALGITESPEPIVADPCAALVIDGETVGVTNEPEALAAALDKLLVDYRSDYDDATTTEFVNDVQVEKRAYDSNTQLLSADELMQAAEGRFSISLSTDWSYDIEIPYDSDVTYDEDKDADYEEVTQEGEAGAQTVYVRLTYIDGVFTDSEVTAITTTKEPVTEKVIRGSKEAAPAKSSGTSTGSFIWPLPHTHNITSYMEWRWGRMHNGVDIAGGGDYGQPIIAADGGTVTWSGNDGGGYGNYVMIDHGNGYMTVYGHASSLAVSTGEHVSQGQTIAYVGSTGNSTGPHLHFEIRLNGAYQNPLDYVS